MRISDWSSDVCSSDLVLLAGCGHDEVRRAPPQASAVDSHAWPKNEPADPAAANAVLMRALRLVGTPYRSGGNTPEGGFDCSGLVNYVYSAMLDPNLPRPPPAPPAYPGPPNAPQHA